MDRDFLAKASEQVVCNTGFLTASDKRALDRAVKRGEIAKWRGYWFPVAGAPMGIGPLKTCYGPVELAHFFSKMRTSINH